VSFQDVVSRISAIQSLATQSLAPVAPPPAASTATSTATLPAKGFRFADVLADATDTTGTTDATDMTTAPYVAPVVPAFGSTGDTPGARALAAAQGEIGAAEYPPGSNDGPRIPTYRSAVAGSMAGAPWCAFFVSWAAAQAGAPIGDGGSGLGSVAQIRDWASRAGRLLPGTTTPQPGDLVLFGDRHVGLVESANPDGSLTTVEGNEGDAVRRVQRSPGEATDFVRL
jgi:hypothetical protein